MDDDDDSDTQGVGLASRRGTRFVSDSLRFTGIDLGDRGSGTSRRSFQHESDDEVGSSASEEEDDEEDDDYDDYDLALLSPEEREEALVQSATARIQRAQAKGKADVSLTKEELGALERRKQRMEEEAEKRERRKRREQRIAVPLAHLEPVSRKKKSAQPASALEESSSSRHPSGSDLAGTQERQQVYPPMGYFPPPSGARSRPRSGTSASQRLPSRALDDRGSSSFHYEYVQRPSSSAGRHVSDSVARPRSSRGYPQDDAWTSNVSRNPSNSSSQNARNPFQFQTAGPRAPHGAAAASRRHVSGPAEAPYVTRRDAGAPAAARSTGGGRRLVYDETSDESEASDDQSTSDDLNSGARIREPVRSRESNGIVAEPAPAPAPEPGPPKKKSSEAPPPKRKPVPIRGGRRKKK